jgi:hypothetical protein
MSILVRGTVSRNPLFVTSALKRLSNSALDVSPDKLASSFDFVRNIQQIPWLETIGLNGLVSSMPPRDRQEIWLDQSTEDESLADNNVFGLFQLGLAAMK